MKNFLFFALLLALAMLNACQKETFSLTDATGALTGATDRGGDSLHCDSLGHHHHHHGLDSLHLDSLGHHHHGLDSLHHHLDSLHTPIDTNGVPGGPHGPHGGGHGHHGGGH